MKINHRILVNCWLMRSFMFLRHLHAHATHFLQRVLHTESAWHFLYNSWTFHSQVIATRTLGNKTTLLTNCIQNARVILFFTLTLWNSSISLWKVSSLRIFFTKTNFEYFVGSHDQKWLLENFKMVYHFS